MQLLLFQTTLEPKLTVINLEPLIKQLNPPTIEFSVDIPIYEDFLFEFC
jgi:hypothetical protein